jgi:hypothetical protein
MPGYNETMLQGMQGVLPQIMGQRRLQEQQQQRAWERQLQAAQLQRQYEVMQLQEQNRAQQLSMQEANQRRLQQGMQDAGSQRNLANEMRMMGLRLQERGQNQPSYGAPENLVTEGGEPMRVLRDSKTGSLIEEGSRQPVPTTRRLLSPMREDELKDIKGSFDEVQAAVDALALMKGRKVGGQRGDPTATGWEGYVPEAAQTLLTPEKGGILSKLTGGGLIGAMGGEAGVATRSSIANLSTMKTKERSGATVTPSEWARLTPYIPTDKDNADVARVKLQRFITEYANLLEGKMSTYKAAGRPIPKPMAQLANRVVSQARLTAKGEQGLSPSDLRALESIYGTQ